MAEPANYHPVSNILFLGKVINRAEAQQLQSFLDNTSTLDSFQPSFHPSHGTEVVLSALADNLLR